MVNILLLKIKISKAKTDNASSVNETYFDEKLVDINKKCYFKKRCRRWK